MKKNLFLVGIFMLFCTVGFSQKKATAFQDFLKSLQGDWKGKLTYTDYRNDSTQVTMDVWLKSNMYNNYLVKEFYYREPDGKTKQKAKSIDTTSIDDKKSKWFETGYKLPFKIKKYENKDDIQKMLIETIDTDNNKLSTIRITITSSLNAMTIKKEVKYNGTNHFFTRHTFYYTK